MDEKKYIVAVDLGDSNVVVAVGSVAEDGLINIEYITTKPSDGVSAGKIVNIELAGNSISAALDEVRDKFGMDVYEAYAGISGEFVYCTGYTDHVFVPDINNGVTQQDVKALFDRMSNVQVESERFIMQRIPQNYVVDDTIEVKNPVGSFGSRLSSTFNFIISENTPLQRLDLALRRQNIKLRRTFSNAVVVGDAVLTPDEKEEGVAVVDIGGGLTNISIYYRNVVRYIATIPIGANAINNDIRSLMIPKQYVESLKLRYGYALAEFAPKEFYVNVKGHNKRESKDVIIYNLATVIEARAKDIAEFVKQEIKDSGFANKLAYGIVLTGGSAELRHIDELFRRVTGLDVRVAEAEDVITPQTREKITSSSESTAVGILIHGAREGFCDVTIKEPIIEIKTPEPPEPPVKLVPEPPVKLEPENPEVKDPENPEVKEVKETVVSHPEPEKPETEKPEVKKPEVVKPEEVKPEKPEGPKKEVVEDPLFPPLITGGNAVPEGGKEDGNGNKEKNDKDGVVPPPVKPEKPVKPNPPVKPVKPVKPAGSGQKEDKWYTKFFGNFAKGFDVSEDDEEDRDI